MTVYEVEDIKKFMSILFKGDVFDRFLLVDAEIRMAVTFRLDGSINHGFADSNEDESEAGTVPQAFTRWESVKALCLDFIKGKRLPLKMKLMLKKPVANELDGRFSYGLNILYEAGKLMLVTNVTAVNFSLERPDNTKWDNYIKGILNNNDIVNVVSTQ